MRDREQLWNGAEQAEKRKDSQLAKDYTIALPHELNKEEQRWAIQDWTRENFVRKGYVVDVNIHRPGKEGDHRNTHAHVMVSIRTVDSSGFCTKKEQFTGYGPDKDDLKRLRESWEQIGNRHLQRAGHKPTLDHRSYEDRGIGRKPSNHLGPKVTKLERNGIVTDRGEQNHNIRQENMARNIVEQFKPYESGSVEDRKWRIVQAVEVASKLDETSRNLRGRGYREHLRSVAKGLEEVEQQIETLQKRDQTKPLIENPPPVSEKRHKAKLATEEDKSSRTKGNRPPSFNPVHARENVGHPAQQVQESQRSPEFSKERRKETTNETLDRLMENFKRDQSTQNKDHKQKSSPRH